MKNKSNIGWWIAGAAALFLLKKKAASVEGIGDIPAWNKAHIRNYLAYEHYGYPERIEIDPTYTDHLGRKLVECYPNDGRISSRTFWVNRENEEYLVDLCKRYGVKVKYLY